MDAEIDLITPDLPSSVEESLSSCPKIRIVLIGNSGVGKSSLVQRIFNINSKDIEVSRFQAAKANIEREYTSRKNIRFILHDSQGLEHSSLYNWDVVENFLRDRSNMEIRDRVHAIWHCIPSPCDGIRLQQTGDEKLLQLAHELNIPVIVVLTKYDEFVKEQRIRAIRRTGKKKFPEDEMEKAAETRFNERIKEFTWPPGMEPSMVRVSSSRDYRRSFEMLLELTNVTRKRLGDEEEGGAISWIIAQQVNANQKVDLSIRQGFKKYWLNLSKSTVFQGRTLNQCLWRIHDDILKVWNFNDPEELLSGQPFFDDMTMLMGPMLIGLETEMHQDDALSKCLDATAAAFTAARPFEILLIAAGVGLIALHFLYGTYRMIPLTAHYIGAYITTLICVLHLLLQETTGSEEPKGLTKELISDVMQRYEFLRIHNRIRKMNALHGFEEKIADVVREETNMLRAAVPTASGSRERRRSLWPPKFFKKKD